MRSGVYFVKNRSYQVIMLFRFCVFASISTFTVMNEFIALKKRVLHTSPVLNCVQLRHRRNCVEAGGNTENMTDLFGIVCSNWDLPATCMHALVLNVYNCATVGKKEKPIGTLKTWRTVIGEGKIQYILRKSIYHCIIFCAETFINSCSAKTQFQIVELLEDTRPLLAMFAC